MNIFTVVKGVMNGTCIAATRALQPVVEKCFFSSSVTCLLIYLDETQEDDDHGDCCGKNLGE